MHRLLSLDLCDLHTEKGGYPERGRIRRARWESARGYGSKLLVLAPDECGVKTVLLTSKPCKITPRQVAQPILAVRRAKPWRAAVSVPAFTA